MSLSITQTPATASLAQSPIIFTVSESSGVINSSSFQYNCDLFYWSGTPSQSGSAQYTLVKYPNLSTVGIFDVSRIINSTLTDLAEQNTSNVKFFKGEFYWTYIEGNSLVTSAKIASPLYSALDGYSIFQEPISQELTDKTPFWPIMTDGPATQSVFETNFGNMGVYVGRGPAAEPTASRMVYSGSYNGNFVTASSVNVSSTIGTSGQISQFVIGPVQDQWPLPDDMKDLDFTVQAFAGNTPLGIPLFFKNKCKTKYPNIRIKWKNRYGQFDWFNFDMVNRQSFNITAKSYQPQIGSWNGTTLSYNDYDSSNQKYISDSTQTLSVNTDWVNEDYNEIFKQLMVSDEVYWIYNERTPILEASPFSEGFSEAFGGEVIGIIRPIIIRTETIEFKTAVVDKLIQYSFDFEWGQNYKLIM
jgi:hypothetical protein